MLHLCVRSHIREQILLLFWRHTPESLLLLLHHECLLGDVDVMLRRMRRRRELRLMLLRLLLLLLLHCRIDEAWLHLLHLQAGGKWPTALHVREGMLLRWRRACSERVEYCVRHAGAHHHLRLHRCCGSSYLRLHHLRHADAATHIVQCGVHVIQARHSRHTRRHLVHAVSSYLGQPLRRLLHCPQLVCKLHSLHPVECLLPRDCERRGHRLGNRLLHGSTLGRLHHLQVVIWGSGSLRASA